MRSSLIFVAAVFCASVVVFLLAVHQFARNPVLWALEHPDYAVAAVGPVIPLAIIARLPLGRQIAAGVQGASTETPAVSVSDAPDATAPAAAFARSQRPVAAKKTDVASTVKPDASFSIATTVFSIPASAPAGISGTPGATGATDAPGATGAPAAPVDAIESAATLGPPSATRKVNHPKSKAALKDVPVPAPIQPEPKVPPVRQFASVEKLAVASVLERGRSVADVARTLKVRPATVEMWVAKARGTAEY